MAQLMTQIGKLLRALVAPRAYAQLARDLKQREALTFDEIDRQADGCPAAAPQGEVLQKTDSKLADRPSSWRALPGEILELGETGFSIRRSSDPKVFPYQLIDPDGRWFASGMFLVDVKKEAELRAAETAEFVPAELALHGDVRELLRRIAR